MLEHLRPQYARNFHCIGSDCEDICCHALDVVIDKATYQKYESFPRFQHLMQHLDPVAHPTDSQFARIRLTPSLTCPFLSPDSMCSIQQEHGPESLADICANYPRVTRRIDGLLEKALHLSCPEAARLVLLDPGLLRPEPGLHADQSPYHALLELPDHDAKANGNPHQYLWELRAFTLLLVRDRSYPLWQRLFLLGMFCKRLKEVFDSGQSELVPQLVRTYAELIVQGKLRCAMDDIPVQNAPQLEVVLEILCRQLAHTDVSHVRFGECVHDFLAGIRHDAATPLDHCVPHYAEACARYYQPFMQAHPYILENYLLNHVFKSRFPFGVDAKGNPNDAQTEFLAICLQYTLIKGLLIGMAGRYEGEFGAQHVVKLIQSFAKAAEHSPSFLEGVNPKVADAAVMAIWLKN